MKFRKLRILLTRISLEKSQFYEDIIFEKKHVRKEMKKVVAEWVNNLHYYKQIKLEKFKDLFIGLDEVVFPIKIKNNYSLHSLDIVIIDNEEKEYYMSKRSFYDYKSMQNYIIGRRDSELEPLIDREFYYKIFEDKTIILMKTSAMRLKKDGTNDDIVVTFCYDYEKNMKEATLKSYASNKKIKINYPTKGNELDKKILAFLFNISESTCCYYDVSHILKWLVTQISDEEVSISITTKIKGEIFSKIDVKNGIVKKHTKTEIIDEEMHIITKVLEENLKTFLTKNS